MAEALNRLNQRQQRVQENGSAPTAKDPMALFRQQMAYMDSVRKASDPAYVTGQEKKEAQAKADAQKTAEKTLAVSRATVQSDGFNTIMPEKDRDFIKVVIDENLTGYAGSRIRLRLLDDMMAGPYLIKKDTYLYALISGFTGQRVTLSVKSIVYQDKILPVKLEVYDLDGLEGLYVPESAFRDFTKDLGTNSVQGVTIDNSGSGSVASQFMMSTVDKMFESTSSAIAGIIRKNKAKIKYNSYLYLIDAKN
jgi:conjugative transposon TraM protein